MLTPMQITDAIIDMEISVVETCRRASSKFPFAIDSVNLFRSPLPNPMSKVSIHRRTEFSVSQIPYS